MWAGQLSIGLSWAPWLSEVDPERATAGAMS